MEESSKYQTLQILLSGRSRVLARSDVFIQQKYIMLIRYVQNDMQSASGKNINETWSLVLKEHKVDVVESF